MGHEKHRNRKRIAILDPGAVPDAAKVRVSLLVRLCVGGAGKLGRNKEMDVGH